MMATVPLQEQGNVVRAESIQPKPNEAAIIKTKISNPSFVVTADHSLKQEESPVYKPREGEALVHIKATGVCGRVID